MVQLVRHRRDDEVLADTIKTVRSGTRDAQRASGTEKAQTTLLAQAAAEAAQEAQTSADGKSQVVRSPSAATGAGSYKQGDQWWQFSGANIVGLWLHSGSAWVAQALTNSLIATLDAGKITTGVLAADRIGSNSITAAKLAATAIDGMTITGALIRTSASGQRIQLDVNGLRAFNSSNQEVARISAGTDGMRVTDGVLEAYGSGSAPNYVRIDARQAGVPSVQIGGNSAPVGRLATNPPVTPTYPDGFVSLSATNAPLHLSGKRVFLSAPELQLSGGTSSVMSSQGATSVQATADGVGNVAKIELTGASGGSINFTASSVTFSGDATGMATPSSGWSVYSGHMNRVVRRGRWCNLQISLLAGSGATLATLCTIPAAFRPDQELPIGTVVTTTGLIGNIYLSPSGVVSVPFAFGASNVGTYYPMNCTWYL